MTVTKDRVQKRVIVDDESIICSKMTRLVNAQWKASSQYPEYNDYTTELNNYCIFMT